MILLPRRKLHYLDDDGRLTDFLPAHLAEAKAAGITVHGGWWDEDGTAWVDVEGIDLYNETHLEIGAKAGMPDGRNGGYRRVEVDAIPEGLVPIEF